ncbi:MAG: putative sugar nucleotidyl transferase [Ignavibacteria bacterium]|nr:putative sugar nucleotidyl transferase [Ignavibacteria bacterium]
MTINICIFEDHAITNLAPINYLRHTSEILCGAFSIARKIKDNTGKNPISLHARKYLSEWLKEIHPNYKVNTLKKDEYIFINSRIISDGENFSSIKKFLKRNNNSAIIIPENNSIIAFHISAELTEKISEIISEEENNLISFGDIEWLDLNKIEDKKLGLDYKLINNPSDLIKHLHDELRNDLNSLIPGKKKIKNNSQKLTSEKSELDTSEGKIYIGKNTVIEPFCYIKGPVFIGDNCVIRSGSCIYGPVSVGNISKISGEITSSIIHSYVNKQHLGFLGHSYICEWVNLGAGTTTSNLKNNYSKISIDIGNVKIDTDSIFLGSIIGDHTKTGISTMLNTGTVIGISSNLYGSGYHKKMVKSFSWNDSSDNTEMDYLIEKAISTARISMSRRKIEMSENYENMLRYLYQQKENLPL